MGVGGGESLLSGESVSISLPAYALSFCERNKENLKILGKKKRKSTNGNKLINLNIRFMMLSEVACFCGEGYSPGSRTAFV